MAIKGELIYKKQVYQEAYIKVFGFQLSLSMEENFKYNISFPYNIYSDSVKDVLLDGDYVHFKSNETDLSFSDCYLKLKELFPNMIDC